MRQSRGSPATWNPTADLTRAASLPDFPSLPVALLDEGVRFRQALRLQGVRVPVDHPPGPQREHAQQHDFGEAGGVLEIAPRRLAALAGVQPVTLVALGPRQSGFRRFEPTRLAPQQTWLA